MERKNLVCVVDSDQAITTFRLDRYRYLFLSNRNEIIFFVVRMHTMLASALLILSSSLCAYANFPQFSGSLKRSMLPAEWKDFRVVKSPTTSANPSAYLVTSLWYGDGFETCTSSPSQLYGFGFDSCLAGVDAGGQAIDYSLIYSYTSQDALYLYFNIANYTSNDCSGSYVNVTSQTPATCLSDGNQGWRYSYVASSTPWDSQPAGIVVK